MTKPPTQKEKQAAASKLASTKFANSARKPAQSPARTSFQSDGIAIKKYENQTQKTGVANLVVVTAGLTQFDLAPSYRGCVDHQLKGLIRGWCVSALNPMSPVSLEIYLGNQLIGHAVTGEFRSDISKGLNLPVNCGFQFQMDSCATAALVYAQKFIQDCLKKSYPLQQLLNVRIVDEALRLPYSPNCRFSNDDCLAILQALDERLGMETKNKSTKIRNNLLEIKKPSAHKAFADIRIVAFYLPQFHPFAENSEWWGEGFTEWTNVTSAKALYPKHDQPRLPADLGYYDLRVDAVHEQQITLARKYGVAAFCYHHYWFSGTSLMNLPVNRHVELNYDLDFCLCWANENWSRRWDGSESDVLMAQQHTESDDIDFIHSVIPYFLHDRYLKIEGAPLLVIYRISLLSNPKKVIARWKALVRKAGFPDLHVCMAETFGLENPNEYSADSSCQFPPHGVHAAEKTSSIKGLNPDFTGKIYEYADVVAGELRRPKASHVQFRTAMPSWDNTSRRGLASHIFDNASPEMFEAWMAVLCAKAFNENPADQRIVFVNAWNEWAEGAYLEPDRRIGHDNLNAVRNALSVQSLAIANGILMTAGAISVDKGDEIVRTITTLANSNYHLLKLATDHGRAIRLPSPFVRRPPQAFHQVVRRIDASIYFDSFNGRDSSAGSFTLLSQKPLHLSGWVRIPGIKITKELPIFLQLAKQVPTKKNEDFIAAVHDREHRQDVAAAFGDDGLDQWYGFRMLADISAVTSGSYSLEILVAAVINAKSVYSVSASLTIYVG
jgi:Glycosyltransferase WbsX